MAKLPHTFDPDAPAQPGSGVFGLPYTRDDASIILTPVPFDATTSYATGAARGPRAILDASAQVDLYDHQFGRVYETGIFMEDIPEDIFEHSAHTRSLTHAQPCAASRTSRCIAPPLVAACYRAVRELKLKDLPVANYYELDTSLDTISRKRSDSQRMCTRLPLACALA